MIYKVGDIVKRIPDTGADGVIAILVEEMFGIQQNERYKDTQVFRVKYRHNAAESQWNSTNFEILTPLEQLL